MLPKSKSGFAQILILVGILVVALAGAYYFGNLKTKPSLSPSPTVTGYTPLPTPSSTPTPAPFGHSGIMGVATIWPTMPHCEIGKPCSTPYQGTVNVKRADNLSEVIRFATNADGTFKIALSPGEYILTSESSLPPTLSQRVTVTQNSYTTINIQFDSGIR